MNLRIPRRKLHEVRIIGGAWKRSKLAVLDRPGLRPTPDRVRETLFNWLGQNLEGWHCLDAFAGSGALGFEAGSRGAAKVVLLERDPQLLQRLREAQQRLHATQLYIEQADALSWMQHAPSGCFQLICLDPPFEARLFEPALTAALPLLATQGWLYLEAPHAWSEQALGSLGYALHRRGRAGAVHFHLLQRAATLDAPPAKEPPF